MHDGTSRVGINTAPVSGHESKVFYSLTKHDKQANTYKHGKKKWSGLYTAADTNYKEAYGKTETNTR